MWTQFMDMHSGGGLKEKQQYIYIEAPPEEAKIIFYNRFGHNPLRVSCTCCGEDYSISEDESLNQLTAYHRGCEYIYRNSQGDIVKDNEAWACGIGLKQGYTRGYEEVGKFISLEQYLKQEDVLVIYAKDIKDDEREGEVPEQGYIWKE